MTLNEALLWRPGIPTRIAVLTGSVELARGTGLGKTRVPRE
jgi:hypothetical protein